MKCEVTILSDEGGTSKSPPIWVTADTGAGVTCLPASQLDAVGVAKAHNMTFTDAGGQHTTRSTGYAWIEVAGRKCRTLVQFNTDRDALLLSASRRWPQCGSPRTPARTSGFPPPIRRTSCILRSNT